MISREQAERTGDALLASARVDQEKAAERNTKFLVHMFPSLKHVPPLERQAAINEARGIAGNHVASRVLLALVTLGFAAYIALFVAGRTGNSMVAVWFTAGTFIARQLLEQHLMRRHLRQLAGGNT